ncbi:phage tail length tape measure family protein [Roseomonas sp. NAR14]|uniref:Phage tail length tape measure family protein n=1 Tax=Roseomonas acroporae TaxID=2937791 RepID=A0A9X1YFD4_9PROT|nr:phage tail length tape measure family protein [Roseomonas acroporae]MCK8787637.1 phage tail length tape measure family protein [Roseomonas acroporae]
MAGDRAFVLRLRAEGADDIKNVLSGIAGSSEEAKRAFNSFDAALRQSGKSADATQKDVDRINAALGRLTASVDPVAAAFQRLQAAEKLHADAQAKGITITRQQADALNVLRQRYREAEADANKAGGAVKLRGDQIQNLGFQFQDFAVQIASGGGFFRPFVQQAPQAIGAVGGLTSAMTLLRAGLTPLNVGIGLVAGGIGAVAVATEASERRLSTLRNSLRLYTSDYAGLAQRIAESARTQAAQTPGLDRSDAQAAQAAILQVQPSLSDAQVRRFTQDVLDLSKTIDGDFQSALTSMTRGLRDPMALFQEMAERHVPGFDQALRQNVERLLLAGDRAGAFNVQMEALRKVIQGASNDMSPMQRAMDGLNKSFNSLWEGIGPGLAQQGKDFLDFLRQATDLARGLSDSGLGRFLSTLSNANPMADGMAAGGWIRRQLGLDGAAVGAPGAGSSAMDRIGFYENSGRTSGVNQLGYTGRYQFGTAALADMGMYQPAPGESLSSQGFRWRGTVTVPGFAPMNQSQFDANLDAQNAAMTERLRRINEVIDRSGILRENRTVGGQPLSREGLDYVGHFSPVALQEFIADLRAGREPGSYTLGDNPPARTFYNRGAGLAGGSAAAPVPVQVVPGSAPSAAPPAGGAATLPAVTATATAAASAASREAVEFALRMSRGQLAAGDMPAGGTSQLRSERQAAYATTISRMQGALPSATPAEQQIIQQGIARIRAEAEGATSAYQQWIEAQQRSAAVQQQAEGPQREIAQAIQQATEAAKRDGQQQLTAAQRQEVTAATLARLNGAYAQTVRGIDLQITAQDKIAAAYEQGGAAVERAQNRERAITEVRKSGVAGTQAEGAAVDALAAKYDALTQKQNDNALRQQVRGQDNTLATLRLQASLIGTDTAERDRRLATLRAEQELEGKNYSPEMRQAYIDRAVQITDQTNALNRQSAALQEVAGFGDQVFNRVGSALTEAFTQGKDAAVNWGTVTKGIISEVAQEILKLSVLNPLKNALFGGNSTTLSDVGGIIGKLINGTGGAASAGGTIWSAAGSVTTNHTGGIAGSEWTSMRTVPWSVFREAPRYHTGGVAGDEVPAILRQGEGVFTKGQMAALGAGMQAGQQQSQEPVALHLNIDARGAGPREIDQLRAQIPMLAKAAVAEASQRGGGFSRAVRGR